LLFLPVAKATAMVVTAATTKVAARALEGAAFVATRGAEEEGGEGRTRQSTLCGRWEWGDKGHATPRPPLSFSLLLGILCCDVPSCGDGNNEGSDGSDNKGGGDSGGDGDSGDSCSEGDGNGSGDGNGRCDDCAESNDAGECGGGGSDNDGCRDGRGEGNGSLLTL
jgi:hypothetical protein